MAPSLNMEPAEFDVFIVPHTRMKGLVDDYFQMLKKTNFRKDVEMDTLLESLLCTFKEFKNHEQIENKFIMKKLKIKLKQLSIQDTAVCNCHKDDGLNYMMRVIKDGYKKKTDTDRANYVTQLQHELEEFTKTFLPHMKEEEEIFQPMLEKYFDSSELKKIRDKVIHHHLVQEHLRELGLERLLAQEIKYSSSESEDDFCRQLREQVNAQAEEKSVPQTKITDLPYEVIEKVFGYLNPRDLLRCAQVCTQWTDVAHSPARWKILLPVQWAQGDWSFTERTVEDVGCGVYGDTGLNVDDDADVDESEENDDIHKIKHERHMISCLTKYVLKNAGTGAKRINLSNSKAVTNSLVNKLLQRCPNVEHLDLTQTRISDQGLKSLGKNTGCKLKSVVLSGCYNITDSTLVRLAVALSKNSITKPDKDSDNYENNVPDNDLNSRKKKKVPTATLR